MLGLVGMSASSIFKNYKFNSQELIVGFGISCFCLCCFLKQSVMFLLWLKNGSCNIYEIFMRETRLKYLSNAIRITFYLIWFVRYNSFKLEFLRSLESENSFVCDSIMINLTIESGLVTKTKVVDNFLIFPTM
jgi:hypothetical protein